jgi:hypothetical protein
MIEYFMEEGFGIILVLGLAIIVVAIMFGLVWWWDTK